MKVENKLKLMKIATKLQGYHRNEGVQPSDVEELGIEVEDIIDDEEND